MSTGARTQANRAMALTPPASLPADQLLLVGVQGEEAISRLYTFHLDLLAENGQGVPFDQVLGKKVAIRFGSPDATVRYLHGIVSRIGQGAETTYSPPITWTWSPRPGCSRGSPGAGSSRRRPSPRS